MFITFLLYFVNALFTILSWAIFARIVLSFLPIRPGNPFYSLAVILHQITEPILAPLRRIIPTIGMFDITPIIAMVLLQVGERVLVDALVRAARGF